MKHFNPRYKGIVRAELIELKKSMSTSELARKYEVSEGTIGYHLRKDRETRNEEDREKTKEA